MGTQPQMSAAHARAFQDAARHFNVYILVRQTNILSLQYVGKPKFVPKRLDCKAKTADTSFSGVHGQKKVGGLVVDPTITGPMAFNSSGKYQKALKEWSGFESKMLRHEIKTMAGQKRLTYIPNGGFYFVDLEPKSEYYGCVKFASNSLITAGKYIHGDFDLYGIVRADNPSQNVAVQEKRLGQVHARSPEFLDVQTYVNRVIGVPMILHGAQETYDPAHSDEALDIFAPDGTMSVVGNAGEIARLYATVFRGRKLFTRDGPRETVRGDFKAPA